MKTLSRFIPLLFSICVQCVIPWNPLRGCQCPPVADLFQAANWPPDDQALLQYELEKLWALPTGKLIILRLKDLLEEGGQKIELRQGESTGANLDRATFNPYLKGFLGRVPAPLTCYLLGEYDANVGGYKICRGAVPAFIILGHEMLHLIDGLQSPQDFVTCSRGIEGWKRNNEGSAVLQLLQIPHFDAIWTSQRSNKYEELYVALGTNATREGQYCFTENQLLIEAGIGFKVGYNPSMCFYEHPSVVELILEPYHKEPKDVAVCEGQFLFLGPRPHCISFNRREALINKFSFFNLKDDSFVLKIQLKEVLLEGTGVFDRWKKTRVPLREKLSLSQSRQQCKHVSAVTKAYENAYLHFVDLIESSCSLLLPAILIRSDVRLAYEVDLDIAWPKREWFDQFLTPKKSPCPITVKPNLGLIRYESFYLKTGKLLLKIGDGRSLIAAIRWYNEIHRFLPSPRFLDGLDNLSMHAIAGALQSVNVAISQWNPDGDVQHYTQCGNSGIHLEFLQDEGTYYLCVDPKSSPLCLSPQDLKGEQESLEGQKRRTQEEQGDEAAWEMVARDFEKADRNLQTIMPQIKTAGYTIRPIEGDGNCGLYAILQALQPDQDYAHVRPDTPQWNNAAGLRQTIVDINPALFVLREMVTGLRDTGGRWMGFDALPTVAQYIDQQHHRPLIAINTNPTERYPMFAIYTNGTVQPAGDFQAALAAAGKNSVILLGTPGHWETVLPLQPQ